MTHNEAVLEEEELVHLNGAETEAEHVPALRQKKTASTTSFLARHARKCKICSHKDREDIEDDFLHWHRCTEISWDYGIKDVRAVYRHAHATGLYERRNKNVRHAIGHIVEHADTSRTSATAVLAAIRALSLIDENGVWHEPVRHNIVEHRRPADSREKISASSGTAEEAPETSAATPHLSRKRGAAPPPPASPRTGFFNRYLPRLKNAATQTKQSPDPESNRHFSTRLHNAENQNGRGAGG